MPTGLAGDADGAPRWRVFDGVLQQVKDRLVEQPLISLQDAGGDIRENGDLPLRR